MAAITLEQLIGAGVAPTQARQFVDPLNAAMALFAIDSPVRQAAFVAQCVVESDGFRSLEENLYYTNPERIRAVFPGRIPSLQIAMTFVRNPKGLANQVYAARMGNGNVESNDGWNYRGRGCFQITGRNNYSDAALELGRPYLEQPELVGQPSDAALTAAWYWHCNKLNLLADASNIDAITKAINGPGMLKRVERKQYFDQAFAVFAGNSKNLLTSLA